MNNFDNALRSVRILDWCIASKRASRSRRERISRYVAENIRKATRLFIAAILAVVTIWSQISLAQDCSLCRHKWARIATPEKVRILFDAGVSPNGLSGFNEPLIFLIASNNSDPEVAQVFVDEAKKQEIELVLQVKHELGYVEDTVLHQAARNKSSEMVKFFLRLGVDPNVVNGRGKSPLQAAPGYSEDPDVYEALLQAGANPNSKDNLGWTVLHSAARFSTNPDIFRVLVEHGGDVNARSDNGLTPLLIATRYREAHIAELLRSLGAY